MWLMEYRNYGDFYEKWGRLKEVVHILLQSSVPYAYTRWPVSDPGGDICSHN